jgi:hypothetical protein
MVDIDAADAACNPATCGCPSYDGPLPLHRVCSGIASRWKARIRPARPAEMAARATCSGGFTHHHINHVRPFRVDNASSRAAVRLLIICLFGNDLVLNIPKLERRPIGSNLTFDTRV